MMKLSSCSAATCAPNRISAHTIAVNVPMRVLRMERCPLLAAAESEEVAKLRRFCVGDDVTGQIQIHRHRAAVGAIRSQTVADNACGRGDGAECTDRRRRASG